MAQYQLYRVELISVSISKLKRIFHLPVPLIPIVAALNAGGHLVAHSAGGLIVYSATTSGYVAGTYISTAGLASFMTGTVVVAGTTGAAVVSGAAIWAYGTAAGAVTSLIGGAGLFGTTIGATGITGVLMSWGVLDSVPILVPVFLGSLLLCLFSAALFQAILFRRLRRKAVSTPEGQEAKFSKLEAKFAERFIKSASKPHSWAWKKWMSLWGCKEWRRNPSI